MKIVQFYALLTRRKQGLDSIAFVILGMRQHMEYVDVFHWAENNRNQPVVFPFDVEDRAVAVHIRMVKRAARIREIPPVGAARRLLSFHQMRFGVRMSSPELPKSTLADDPHGRTPITNDPVLGSSYQVQLTLPNYGFPMKQ
jgi:hypothetical protein